MQIQLTLEREAQLHEYARCHGQDISTALDEVLGDALEWEHLDREEAIEGVRRGIASMKAGHTRPASEFLREFQEKHGL